MTLKLEVLPFAQDDIQEAYSYYEEISIELAEDLLANIDEVFETIIGRPLQPQIIFEEVRKVNTHRFLYGIYY